jgi:hypothetical protein
MDVRTATVQTTKDFDLWLAEEKKERKKERTRRSAQGGLGSLCLFRKQEENV